MAAPFVAVNTYVVVCAGAINVEPAPEKPAPLIETVVAPVTFHDNMVDWPGAIADGLAVNELMTGGGVGATGTTVTITGAETLPDALVAVKG